MTMSLQHIVARSKARGLLNGSVTPDLAQAMTAHRLLVLEGDALLASALLKFVLSLQKTPEPAG